MVARLMQYDISTSDQVCLFKFVNIVDSYLDICQNCMSDKCFIQVDKKAPLIPPFSIQSADSTSIIQFDHPQLHNGSTLN